MMDIFIFTLMFLQSTLFILGFYLVKNRNSENKKIAVFSDKYTLKILLACMILGFVIMALAINFL